MSFLRQHITPEDYALAKVAYNTWHTMTLLNSNRRMPDSTIRRWDDLPRGDQEFIWNLFRIPEWDDLGPWQRDSWALAMQRALRETPAARSARDAAEQEAFDAS